MKNWHIRIPAIVALLTIACSAAVADPGYRYIEAGYLGVDPDGSGSSGSNGYGEASLSLLRNLHVSGRYVGGEYTENIDLSFWKVAVGAHGLLGDKGDLVGELSWNDQKIGSVTDDGIGLTAGVRFTGIDVLELDGLIHWTDYSDVDSKDSYEIRGIFNLSRFGLGAAGEFSSDDTRYSAFARFYLGK